MKNNLKSNNSLSNKKIFYSCTNFTSKKRYFSLQIKYIFIIKTLIFFFFKIEKLQYQMDDKRLITSDFTGQQGDDMSHVFK